MVALFLIFIIFLQFPLGKIAHVVAYCILYFSTADFKQVFTMF